MNEWISVDDRLPEKGEEVIGYDSFYGRISVAVLQAWGNPRLIFLPEDDDCDITHWMPLPEPPDVDDDEFAVEGSDE